MPQVREDDRWLVRTRVGDDTDAYLVGASLQSYGDHCGGRRGSALMFDASRRGDVGKSYR